MIERVENENYKSFKLDIAPSLDLCLLPNGHFCYAAFYSITIYDQSFNIVNRVNRINEEENKLFFDINSNEFEDDDPSQIHLNGVAFNKRNEIYVSDSIHDCILMMDFNLNLIKSFGTTGEENDQFRLPYGLCCKNDRLYVCDFHNTRIQIFSLDIEYIDTIKLNCRPQSLGISDSTIGIESFNGVYFYDLETKELKKQYVDLDALDNMDKDGKIHQIDSYFFYINLNDEKISCFDKDGVLIKDILFEESNEWQPYFWDGCILFSKFDANFTYASNEIFYYKF
jgi:hypothetical protein